MDRRYELNGVSFVWDVAKARRNMAKHGVSFEAAATVFFDPFIRIEDASRAEESRDAATGWDSKARILYVVHLQLHHQAIRIISARKATREERQRYDQ